MQRILGRASLLVAGATLLPSVALLASSNKRSAGPPNLPPVGVGLPFDKVDLTASQTPDVSVDAGLSAADQRDMKDIIDTSIAILRSDQFLANARALKATYPKVYIGPYTTQRDLEAAVQLLRSPSPGWGYGPTRLAVQPGRSGAATSNYGERPRTNLHIYVNNLPLTNWRAANRVQKSCAINTVAHEISHTLLKDPRGYFPVFTDGNGAAAASRKNGTTGSYLIGQLAQCTYLQNVNRISADQVKQCIPVFYATPVFAHRRCDDYNETEPVVIKKKPPRRRRRGG